MRSAAASESESSGHPAAAGAGGRLTWVSLAMRNLRRNLIRNVGIGAAVAAMAGSLLAISVALLTVDSGVGRGAARLGVDIVVVPKGSREPTAPRAAAHMLVQPTLDYAVVEQLEKVEVIVPQYGGRPPLRVPGVAEATAQLSLTLRDVPWSGADAVRVTGFEPETDIKVLPWLQKPLGRPLRADEALVGHALARLAGETIDLGGRQFSVAGVLEQTWTEGMDHGVFVRLPVAWSLLPGSGTGPERETGVPPHPISRVLLRSQPEVDPLRVVSFIRSTVPDVEPRVSDEAMAALGTQLRLSVTNLAIIAGSIWFTTLLLVGSAFSMVIRERQRELGLLRAMGATRGGIVGLLSLEMVTACSLGGAAGIAAGLIALLALEGILRTHFGLAWAWPGAGHMLGLGLLCLLVAPATGLLAALAPTLRAAGLEPHVAIHDTP